MGRRWMRGKNEQDRDLERNLKKGARGRTG